MGDSAEPVRVEERVKEWLSTKLQGATCWLCGCKGFTVLEVTVIPRSPIPFANFNSLPVVPVVCKSCFQVFFFAAMALADPPADPPADANS